MEYTQQQLDMAMRAAEEWMSLPGIEGVAQGESDGSDCILVWHSLPAENYLGSIPKQIHAVPVVMVNSSIIQAQDGGSSIL